MSSVETRLEAEKSRGSVSERNLVLSGAAKVVADAGFGEDIAGLGGIRLYLLA